MRLSDWQARAPFKESMAPKVVEVIRSVTIALGAGADPGCWVSWGDDPAARYVVFAPTAAGLLQIPVRVNIPLEGPRASAKLIRWSRLSVGELAVEMADGHRLLSFQVEGQVFKGSDAEADAIAAFALELFAAIDGRAFTPPAMQKGGKGVRGTAARPLAVGAPKAAPAGRARPAKPTLALPAPRGDGT